MTNIKKAEIEVQVPVLDEEAEKKMMSFITSLNTQMFDNGFSLLKITGVHNAFADHHKLDRPFEHLIENEDYMDGYQVGGKALSAIHSKTN